MNTPQDFTSEDRTALLDTVQRFATQAIAPHVSAWDEAGEFPRSLHHQAAELGLLGLGYPEHLGGTPAPWSVRNAMSQTLARFGGSGGVMASLFTHNIGLPPVLAHGTPELQAEVIPPVLRGEQIAALGITEPGGGSDVAALRTTARLEGKEYVIDGEKVFITSGMRCDWITLAVRTDEPPRSAASRVAAPQGGSVALGRPGGDRPLNKGASGISMIVVPCHTPGISRSKLHKMGWHCSDTAHIRFDGVRVPARYRLGAEGAGFRMIMGNFNGERLAMSAMALGFAQACYDEALAWARQRSTFGAPLIERQVIRHKLMDMQMRIQSTQAWVDALGARADAGDDGAVPPPGRPKAEQPSWGAANLAQQGSVGAHSDWVANVCLLKNHATQTMQHCADAAVQILGAMGYMRGTVSERVYREVKVMMIGGGAEEIMKELAARQWAL